MGTRRGSPYTAAVELKTSRVTPSWRIASSSSTPAATLVR
jgi:hypothetical protein